MSITQIAEEFGRDRKTSRKWLKEDAPKSYVRQKRPPSILEPFKPYSPVKFDSFAYLPAGYSRASEVLYSVSWFHSFLIMNGLHCSFIDGYSRFHDHLLPFVENTKNPSCIQTESASCQTLFPFAAWKGFLQNSYP
jgi:hypothetical protein